MRIQIVGAGVYSHVNVEYDVLMSTPVMNVKARIMVGILLVLIYSVESIWNSAFRAAIHL